MKFKFLMGTMLAMAFCATPTWAGHGSSSEATDKMSGPNPSNYSITLTLSPGGGGAGTTGPCTGGEGFADYCPSGTCDCYTYSGSVKGSAGSGSFVFYETFDQGDGTFEERAASFRQ